MIQNGRTDNTNTSVKINLFAGVFVFIVPCHRVIGVNGKLTGYAGGVEHKAFLLKLEGIINCDE